MHVDVVLLPAHLTPGQLSGRVVAIFDVLRATTTMAAALAAGVQEIRIFPDVAAARAGAQTMPQHARLLCGETKCLPPPGFDLGNSPVDFNAEKHAGRTVFISTTNGTRAILAAKEAAAHFAAALVNASATARALAASGRDITLLCAGTDGQVAMEDLIGCGAVIDALFTAGPEPWIQGDPARIALRLFRDNRHRLREVLADGQGGRNVISAGLPKDVDFAARLDSLDVVAAIEGDPPAVRLAKMEG
jgi:2-phosphosulfolactate phosphatase